MKIKYYLLIDLFNCDYPLIFVDFRSKGVSMYFKFFDNYFLFYKLFKNDCFDCLFYGL